MRKEQKKHAWKQKGNNKYLRNSEMKILYMMAKQDELEHLKLQKMKRNLCVNLERNYVKEKKD